jgi:hypothetical protein
MFGHNFPNPIVLQGVTVLTQNGIVGGEGSPWLHSL